MSPFLISHANIFMNDEACSCLNRGSQCVSDWREWGLLRWTGPRLRRRLSPTAESVSRVPRILNDITPTSVNEFETERKVLLSDGEWEARKTATFIPKFEEFSCFLVSFDVCVFKFSTLKHWGLIRYFLYFLLVFIYSRMHIIIITFPRSNRPWLLLS